MIFFVLILTTFWELENLPFYLLYNIRIAIALPHLTRNKNALDQWKKRFL